MTLLTLCAIVMSIFVVLLLQAGWYTLYGSWALEPDSSLTQSSASGTSPASSASVSSTQAGTAIGAAPWQVLLQQALEHFLNAVRISQSPHENMPAMQLNRFTELTRLCRRQAKSDSSSTAPATSSTATPTSVDDGGTRGTATVRNTAAITRSGFPHADDFGGPARSHRLWRNFWDEVLLIDIYRRLRQFSDAQLHLGIAAQSVTLLFRVWMQKRKLELQFGVSEEGEPAVYTTPIKASGGGGPAARQAMRGPSAFSVDLKYAHEMLELQTYLSKTCKSADRAPMLTLSDDLDEPFAI